MWIHVGGFHAHGRDEVGSLQRAVEIVRTETRAQDHHVTEDRTHRVHDAAHFRYVSERCRRLGARVEVLGRAHGFRDGPYDLYDFAWGYFEGTRLLLADGRPRSC